MTQAEQYTSQNGQDEYLDKVVFNRKKNGIFIDIGAYDGIDLSNTYFFEKHRGWSGLCFEPTPNVFKKLISNRNCICVNACVDKEESSKQFINVEGLEVLNGLAYSYDEEHMNRLKQEAEESNKTLNFSRVNTVLLNKVCELNSINNADYCSIDVEGNELEILKSIDFDRLRISVFSIECNYDFNALDHFMFTRGYKMINKLGADVIYVRHDIRDKLKILFSATVSRLKKIASIGR